MKEEGLSSRCWRNRERGDPCDREVSRKKKIVTDTGVGNTEKKKGCSIERSPLSALV